METLFLLFFTVFGQTRAARKAQGSKVVLTERQQLDLLYLVRCGREVEAIRQVRAWTGLSLRDAVSAVQALKVPGLVHGSKSPPAPEL